MSRNPEIKIWIKNVRYNYIYFHFIKTCISLYFLNLTMQEAHAKIEMQYLIYFHVICVLDII